MTRRIEYTLTRPGHAPVTVGVDVTLDDQGQPEAVGAFLDRFLFEKLRMRFFGAEEEATRVSHVRGPFEVKP